MASPQGLAWDGIPIPPGNAAISISRAALSMAAIRVSGDYEMIFLRKRLYRNHKLLLRRASGGPGVVEMQITSVQNPRLPLFSLICSTGTEPASPAPACFVLYFC